MKRILMTFILISLFAFTAACQHKESSNSDEKSDKLQAGASLERVGDYEARFEGDWNRPGLYEKDGSPHIMPLPLESSVLVDVSKYGLITDEPNENRNHEAVAEAIYSAMPGDLLYFPAGNYYFNGYTVRSYISHIWVNKSLTLAGDPNGGTNFISRFPEQVNKDSIMTTTIAVVNTQDVVIKDINFTSDTPNPTYNSSSESLNPEIYTGPRNQIAIDTKTEEPDYIAGFQTNNVVVENCLFEKYIRIGIRITNVRDCTLRNNIFKNALSLGSGGAGYGICLQGNRAGEDNTDGVIDTRWNIIENNIFQGPYLRHAILLQNYTHNNLIKGNETYRILLDAIDLHGQLEYSNEITQNYLEGTRNGAGIGIGNTGGSAPFYHGPSGRNNYIHGNTILRGLRGIDVMRGSRYQIIANNYISQTSSFGFDLRNCNDSYFVNNRFEDINNRGIRLIVDGGIIPNNIVIKANEFNNVRDGIYVERSGSSFICEDNVFLGSYNSTYINNTPKPFDPQTIVPVFGINLLPLQMNFADSAAPNAAQTQNGMKLKSGVNANQNRLIYALFETTAINEYEKVYLVFNGKANIGGPTITFSVTSNYVDWTEENLTWNNALYRNNSGRINNFDNSISKLTDFTFKTDDGIWNTYYLDITNGYNSINSNLFTIIISDESGSDVYCEIFNHKVTETDHQFRLVFN